MNSPELFAARAEEILRLIEEVREKSGLAEAITVAAEHYVEGETHPELARFGEVLTRARRQALLQERLDSDRETLHHGQLSHEELTSLGHHYEMLRREACEYNHLLRGLIESCGQYFLRDNLTDWLRRASQGHEPWAIGEITGAVSEIALHAALQGLPELRGLRYASLEEDLRGYDFVSEWQGGLVTVDAKTGFYTPLAEHKHGHRHLEVSVPREAVKDFRVPHRWLERLRRDVRRALQHDAGAEVHSSHHYFASA